MTTLNITNAAVKITRAEAIQYAMNNLVDAPADVMEVLGKIYDTFTKRPAGNTESKVAKENKALAAKLTEYVNNNFDPDRLDEFTAKALMDVLPGVATTQKVVAIARHADVKTVKVKGRTYYVPMDTEIVA